MSEKKILLGLISERLAGEAGGMCSECDEMAREQIHPTIAAGHHERYM
jgi:hypothetical protein